MFLEDNIIKNEKNWKFPYRFVIGRKSKYSDSVEILGWTAEPGAAYIAYSELLEEVFDDFDEAALWEYFLHDSFHIDAIDFCRDAYEKVKEYL